MPVSAGFALFARLAPKATCKEDEKKMVAGIMAAGVVVRAGHEFPGVINQGWGWARIAFAVDVSLLRKALEKIRSFLN